jgi:outer membrane protein OmpA-like peptidoglycan-associated protein
MRSLRTSIALLGLISLSGCASMSWPEGGAGGMAEATLGRLLPIEADQPLQPEHGLRFDLELSRQHLDTLILQGAELCFPATVVQAEQREARIARQLEGGLSHDAANDILIQRKTLARLERQLDYVREEEVCVIPKVAGEDTPGRIGQSIDELLNSDNQFAFGSHELNPKYVGRLAEAATLLRDQPQFHLEITGHADSVGAPEGNLELSRARAEQVGRYLNIMGIPPARIRVAAAGSESPLFDGEGAERRLVNRRVSIELIEVTNAPVLKQGEKQ